MRPATRTVMPERFTIPAVIDNRALRFTYTWNRKGKFFAIQVAGPDGVIGVLYPQVDEVVPMAAFNVSSQRYRDATIVLERTGEVAADVALSPKTIALGYRLRIATGQFRGG